MSENNILEEIRKSSKQAAIPFAVAILFMGLTFSPIEYGAQFKWMTSLMFLILGLWVFSSAFWPMKTNLLSGFVRYGITMLAGILTGVVINKTFF